MFGNFLTTAIKDSMTGRSYAMPQAMSKSNHQYLDCTARTSLCHRPHRRNRTEQIVRKDKHGERSRSVTAERPKAQADTCAAPARLDHSNTNSHNSRVNASGLYAGKHQYFTIPTVPTLSNALLTSTPHE